MGEAEQSEQLPAMRRGEARELLRLARGLLRRAGDGVPVARREEVEASCAALEEALRSRDDLEIARHGAALDAYCAGLLAPWRKSRGREMVESIGVALVLALILRAFVIEAFQIPSGSMEPTLLPGDRLFVSKFSFGVRVPLTRTWPVTWGALRHGDVVVFVFPSEDVRTQITLGQVAMRASQFERAEGRLPATLDELVEPGALHALRPEMLVDAWGTRFAWDPEQAPGQRLRSAGRDRAFGTGDDIALEDSAFRGGNFACVDVDSLERDKDYIKRVVGLPGDRIRMANGVLYVNDVPVEREDVGPIAGVRPGGPRFEAIEIWPGGRGYRTWHAGMLMDFEEVRVRPGHFLAMGDNRDHSSDSRCWGQVPMENLKGRALFLFFSSGPGEGVRWGRLFNRVR